jgi:UDP-N-acetylmuramoyl-L-alanyl-D-glutamate--2,6-diaminopimelate ligase/murE/murF fusion protein
LNLAQLIRILDIPPEIASDFSSYNLTESITSVHYNSKETGPKGLFVAIKGFRADGHDFIAEAVQNGASVIVAQKPVSTHVPVLVVENTRKALATIAAEFFGHLAHNLQLIGITGTSGKTTVTYLLESIFFAAGLRCGVIGTINYRFAEKVYPNPVTTPESLDLQRILAKMYAADVTHVIIEVSSHALDLHRVEQCAFDVGVFTNLTQDHLDYHQSMACYWECKKRLFNYYLKPFGKDQIKAQAVINCDNDYGLNLFNELRCLKLSTGIAKNAAIRAVRPQISQAGIKVKIETPMGSMNITSPLVGGHNLENLLSAIGAAVAMGISLDVIKKGIEGLKSVPGRLESVPNNINRYVYVDYAHKPDALLNVLNTLRPLLSGRLICVMGCGGDRDKTKRPIMGEITGRLADLTIITSDNPRNEPLEKIIAQIIMGVRKSLPRNLTTEEILSGVREKGFVVQPDRKKAIHLAIAASNPFDTILIAGKGHENYQILGTKTVPFDDVVEVRSALKSERANQWVKN